MQNINTRKYPITMTCICCPVGCTLTVEKEENAAKLRVTGNKCPRGEKYAIEEVTSPKRMITSVVRVINGEYPVVSVKTNRAAPKDKRFVILGALGKVAVMAPIKTRDVLVKNIIDIGIDIVATHDVAKREQ